MEEEEVSSSSVSWSMLSKLCWSTLRVLRRSKLKFYCQIFFGSDVFLLPGCVRQVGQGGQVGIQVNIEKFREDEIVAHDVHWVPDFS